MGAGQGSRLILPPTPNIESKIRFGPALGRPPERALGKMIQGNQMARADATCPNATGKAAGTPVEGLLDTASAPTALVKHMLPHMLSHTACSRKTKYRVRIKHREQRTKKKREREREGEREAESKREINGRKQGAEKEGDLQGEGIRTSSKEMKVEAVAEEEAARQSDGQKYQTTRDKHAYRSIDASWLVGVQHASTGKHMEQHKTPLHNIQFDQEIFFSWQIDPQ